MYFVCVCLRGHARCVGAARSAHTCHYGFVPPFQRRLREAALMLAGQGACVRARALGEQEGQRRRVGAAAGNSRRQAAMVSVSCVAHARA